MASDVMTCSTGSDSPMPKEQQAVDPCNEGLGAETNNMNESTSVPTGSTASACDSGWNERERDSEKSDLIQKVKQEVKRLMEEAVTRKFIHEDSSSVRSLCAVIDQCLVHKLKKTFLGPLNSTGGFWSSSASSSAAASHSTSLSLITKINKQLSSSNCLKQQLTDILSQVQEKQNAYKLVKKNAAAAGSSSSAPNNGGILQDFPSERTLRFLWMRLALFAGILDRVIDLIVSECGKFYERDAFMCDPVVTTLLVSLLVGPCSLDYSKAKTPDHLWTDPHAEELVMKHNIHSSIGYNPTSAAQGVNRAGKFSDYDSPFRAGAFGGSLHRKKPGLKNSTTESISHARPSSVVEESVFVGGVISSPVVSTGASSASAVAGNHSSVSRTCSSGLGGVVTAMPPPVGGLPCQQTPKDYVDSLHQNSRETLLFGKNNVKVQPDSELEPMPGYLSLHQSTVSPTSLSNKKFGKPYSWLLLQWTPNDVMSAATNEKQVNKSSRNTSEVYNPTEDVRSAANEENASVEVGGESGKANQEWQNQGSGSDLKVADRDLMWKYAMTVDMRDVLYIHCHQCSASSLDNDDCDSSGGGGGAEGDTLVLVGHDGVSLPPITFPPSSQPGGHLLAFLSCLENALLPLAQLDPPLWMHRSKGKVFPRLLQKDSQSSISTDSNVFVSGKESQNQQSQLVENECENSGIGNAGINATITAAATDSNQKTSFEKYIRSVSLSNPIGELVQPSKLFDSIRGTSTGTTTQGTHTGGSHNSTTNQDKEMSVTPNGTSSTGGADQSKCISKSGQSNDSTDAKSSTGDGGSTRDDATVDEIESRDFVFRIMHMHTHSTGSPSMVTHSHSTQSGGTGTPQSGQPTGSGTTHFSFSQASILGQRNLLKEAANLTVDSNARPKLQHQQQTQKLTDSSVYSPVQSAAAIKDNTLSSNATRPAFSSSGSLSNKQHSSDSLLSSCESAFSADQSEQSTAALVHSRCEDQDNIKRLCDSMRRQILARAFYGWLTYVRHLKTVRTHLSCLVNTTPSLGPASVPSSGPPSDKQDSEPGLKKQSTTEELKSGSTSNCDASKYKKGLTKQLWDQFTSSPEKLGESQEEILRLIYHGGMEHSIRPEVWLYLLGHYPFGTSRRGPFFDEGAGLKLKEQGGAACGSAVVASNEEIDRATSEKYARINREWQEAERQLIAQEIPPKAPSRKTSCYELGSHSSNDSETNNNSSSSSTSPPSLVNQSAGSKREGRLSFSKKSLSCVSEDSTASFNERANDDISNSQSSINYDHSLLATYSLNLHRIDKDVARCDRNNSYFTLKSNLDTLRRIMCSYVWLNLDVGYVQGMCDLVAPLLVIFDDEAKTFAAFSLLMVRMKENFPHGRAMDQHFSNMRALLQILDPVLFEHMQQNGDYTHFYFCYRWFLLDFKRELKYSQVFLVWETIWASRHLPCGGTAHFVLFLALAFLKMYRNIIINYHMDFTDIIKFFNEMAECHKVDDVLMMARDLVHELHVMLETK